MIEIFFAILSTKAWFSQYLPHGARFEQDGSLTPFFCFHKITPSARRIGVSAIDEIEHHFERSGRLHGNLQ